MLQIQRFFRGVQGGAGTRSLTEDKVKCDSFLDTKTLKDLLLLLCFHITEEVEPTKKILFYPGFCIYNFSHNLSLSI